MGRLLTAGMLSIVSAIGFGISLFMVILDIPSGKSSPFWDMMATLTLICVFVPIPVALLMNLRDWWNQRKAAKSILERKTN